MVNDSNEESFSSGDFLARKHMLCSERIHVRVSYSHVLMNILQPALLIGCMGGEIGLVLFANFCGVNSSTKNKFKLSN